MEKPKIFDMKYKWDVRTGSPRKLWRMLSDFLEDNEFEHEYDELILGQAPIDGTAVFSKQVVAKKDIEKPFDAGLFIGGLLLCVTLVLIPVGFSLMQKASEKTRILLQLSIEGEAYRARGANFATNQPTEVFDIAADARVTIIAIAGAPVRDQSSYEIQERSFNKEDRENFSDWFDRLTNKLGALFPDIVLPGMHIR